MFPPDFKFTKGQKTVACVQFDDPRTDSLSTHVVLPGTPDHGFSKEQYQHLMSLFQQSQISAATQDPTIGFSAMEAFGGVFCRFVVYFVALRCASQSKVNSWILDSGATNHMTPYKELLHNIQPLRFPYLVTLPNGCKVKVNCIGSLKLCNDLILANVLLVPSFQFNLVSVPQLVNQFCCTNLFTDISCCVKDPSLKRPLEIGRAANGLYVIHSDLIMA